MTDEPPAHPASAVPVPVTSEPTERYAYGAALSLPREAGARWTAEVPDLPDCRSEGDGARECMANITDAIAAWITAVMQRGEPLPTPTPLDVLARQPAFARALWLLVRQHDQPGDLAVSKALADAGELPSLGDTLAETPGGTTSSSTA